MLKKYGTIRGILGEYKFRGKRKQRNIEQFVNRKGEARGIPREHLENARRMQTTWGMSISENIIEMLKSTPREY